MTNREKYPKTEDACKAYHDDANTYHDDMLNWLDDEFKAPLPDWVKPGAKYRYKTTRICAFKVESLDYAAQKVNTSYLFSNDLQHSFSDFSNGVFEQYFELPEWVKPGAKFHYIGCEDTRVFTVTGINFFDQKVLKKSGASTGYSHFETFCNGGIEEVKPVLPDWVKPGVRYFMEDMPKKSFLIIEVDRKRGAVLVKGPIEIKGCPYVNVDFAEFMDKESCRLPVVVPDWVKIGTVIGHDDCQYTVTEFNKRGVSITCPTDEGATYLTQGDFENKYVGLHEALPEKPKLPAWVKPGAWVQSKRHRTVYKIAKMHPDYVEFTSTNGDQNKTFAEYYKPLTITPWTAAQALVFLESGKKLLRLGGKVYQPDYLQVQSDGVSIMFMESLESYDLQQLADNFETEDHLPCGNH